MYINGMIVSDFASAAPNGSDGSNERSSTGNGSFLKKERVGSKTYVYVSGQAWRFWLRESMERLGMEASPVVRPDSKKQQSYTNANMVQFADDDLFGFMKATKDESTSRESVLSSGAMRAIVAQRPTEDFGVMGRGASADDNFVLFSQELYTGLMAAPFLIDAGRIGHIMLGGVGHKLNATEEIIEQAKKDGAVEVDFRGAKAFALPLEIRRERLALLLEGLVSMSGGAKQSTAYSEANPVTIVAAESVSPVNIFARNVITEVDREPVFSVEAANALIEDNEDLLKNVSVFTDPNVFDFEGIKADVLPKRKGMLTLASEISEGKRDYLLES